MKYMTFVWSVCFAGILYLPLMLLIWLISGSLPPWWISIGLILLLAFGAQLVILLRQDYQWKNEDVLRPDEAVQTNVEDIKTRRQEAENYILQSGDEEAVQVLQKAQENFYCYNTILLDGSKRGNSTLKIGLAILSGMFGDTDPNDIKDGDIDEALKKMESVFVPNNLTKKEM